MDPHCDPVDRHAGFAEIDLQLLARRRLKANRRSRFRVEFSP